MQLVAERPVADTIRARMNYIVDTGTPPVRYIDWPEMADKEIPPTYQEHVVAIHNGRPVRDTFKLDTYGFVFADHHTKVKDFTDDAERKQVYDPECEALIMKHSGASKVVVFDHTIRVGDEKVQLSTGARPPVKGVHNDYTEASAPQRLREIVGPEEAERRFKKRWAIIQVWRPIRHPVETDPLAICDARTVSFDDFVISERRYPNRIGQTYVVTHNPKHKWYWLPRMRRDEALVFKVYDSLKDGRARWTAHTAFADPTSPPNARPRESIEIRTLAFF